ncbi:hypothetical protein Nmn1133_09860 [Halosegnis longus]|uniref:Survival protein SurE-like phosphatase/nucleotidase domain-containing protein n=1 Tax=Halosegnis longus TaxID=2216012 RepID=A0AAJ4R9C0_9EURY|nr:hypothetical protein Nmn1133_09860 [Salella cibi]
MWTFGGRNPHLRPWRRLGMTDPSILVTNDDGIDAHGIRALADALEAVGDVTVVAPPTTNPGPAAI